MESIEPDLLGILEAAYALAASDEAWLAGVLEAVSPVLDGGLGVGVPVARASRLSRREALAWTRIGAHIAAGLRARRRAPRASPRQPEAPPRMTHHPQTAGDAWRALVEGRLSLLDHFDHRAKRYLVARGSARAARHAPLFTRREEEILALAATGLANKLIASELGVSVSTVVKHMGDVRATLGVTGRIALIHAYRAAAAPRGGVDTPPGLRVAFGGGGVVLFLLDIAPDDRVARLSHGERAVALLAREGRANGEIAAMRGTAVRTVANQVASLMGKLGVASRAELVERFLVLR